MKIRKPIKSLTRNISDTYRQLKDLRPKKTEFEYDVFENNYNAELRDLANKKLSQIHKMTIEEYQKLTEEEKNAIRRSATFINNEVATKSVIFGLKLKNYLDKKYGENNYCFVSLGTSPAGIARVFEFSGVETKYLPISKLTFLSHSDFYNRGSHKIKKYKNFLKEQKMTSEDIAKSNKKYLCFDYTYTGNSLTTLKDIMWSNFSIYPDQMEYLSLNNTISNVLSKEENEDENSKVEHKFDSLESFENYVASYLKNARMEIYSGIPHLNYSKLNWINKCAKYETVDAKKFNFLVIEELDKCGLLKHNPENDTSL